VDPDELSGENPYQVYNLGECLRGDGEGGREAGKGEGKK